VTAPADDCGVSGGCGSCPLGRAGVCGDPVPEPIAAGDYPRGWAVPVTRRNNGRLLMVENDPELGGEQLAIAKAAFDEAADTYVDEALARIARELADAPDVDPAEPKPADAGCCGGGCRG